MAGVRKHPGPAGQRINLATDAACSYLRRTRASRGTKGALPQTAQAGFGHFYYTVSGINFEQQKGPRAVCVTSETKPNQDK